MNQALHKALSGDGEPTFDTGLRQEKARATARCTK